MGMKEYFISKIRKCSRLSLSRNRRDALKHLEISVLRHIRFVVLRKKKFEHTQFYKQLCNFIPLVRNTY